MDLKERRRGGEDRTFVREMNEASQLCAAALREWGMCVCGRGREGAREGGRDGGSVHT
jgi:hypothetical protein